MYYFSFLHSVWRVSLSVLLLLCVSSPTEALTLTVIESSGFANHEFGANNFMWFKPKNREEALHFSITHSVKRGEGFLYFILNNLALDPYPPIYLSVSDLNIASSFVLIAFLTGVNTTVNFTRVTADLRNKLIEPFLFRIEPFLEAGFCMYVRDVVAEFRPENRSHFLGLNIYKERTFNAATTDQSRTGVYLDKVVAIGAKDMVNRNISYYTRLAQYDNEEHVDTLSVTNSLCRNCLDNFFADSATNVIQNSLVRFLNCTHDSTGGFYVPLGDSNGSKVLNLSTYGNIVLSNITTKGPLFGYTPKSDGIISSTARLTLHNITAKSLYLSSTKARLFSSVPSGAQVYVGPMTLDGVTYTSKDDYDGLNLPFTRVIDVNRKVLFTADLEKSAVASDSSQRGEFSAAFCVSDGYSGVSSELASVDGTTEKAKCNCRINRYPPHCTTSLDILGESPCPVGMTMSMTKEKCVSCKMEHCARCDTEDICNLCMPDYKLSQDSKMCGFSLENCKAISNEDKMKCGECDQGFSLTINGRCATRIPDCEKYQDDGTCLACTGSLTPSASGLSCVTCNEERCEKCDNSGECITCENGYTWVGGVGCITCDIPGCLECYEPDKCGTCDRGSDTCTVGGKQDTSKGIPWWVWLIVGLGAAVVLGLIIFFIVWCCFCEEKEFFVTYQEQYNEAEERKRNRDRRLWDRNAALSAKEHGAVFMVRDRKKPRIYRQEENSTHGERDSYAGSDSSSHLSASSDSDYAR